MAVLIAIAAILAIGGGFVGFLAWKESRASQPAPARQGRSDSATRSPGGSNRPPKTPKAPKAAKPADAAPAAGAAATGKSPAAGSATSSKPKALADLKTGGVTLEKAAGSSLVYAVGVLTNDSSHQRYGVRIEVALTDADGKSAGVAKDYRPVIEPGETWRFRALVLDSRAKAGTVTGKVSTISEDP